MDFLESEARVDDTSLPELFGIDMAYFELTGHYPPQLPGDITHAEIIDIIIEFGIDFQRRQEAGELNADEEIQVQDELDYLIVRMQQL